MLSFPEMVFIGLFVTFCVIDTIAKGYRFPKVTGWRSIGIVSFITYFYVTGYSPLLWDNYLSDYTLMDATGWPFALQIIGGFLILQLGVYSWHRTMHNVDPMWRFMHQMHHSADRVDIYGAFYFHPLDMMGWALIGSVVLVGIIGLSGEAAMIVSLSAAFCSMFQHSNMKTPYWLGFIITRPESHMVHHKRDHHAQNYGDIPLFDMIFGTFHNPKVWDDEVGFGDQKSLEIPSMLAGKLIS